MIPKQWYILMDSKQVKDKPVGVTHMGEKLVFWRDGTGRASCLRDRCPHRAVHLPFIHHKTIGRGERTVVDGPALDWVSEDMFYV